MGLSKEEGLDMGRGAATGRLAGQVESLVTFELGRGFHTIFLCRDVGSLCPNQSSSALV